MNSSWPRSGGRDPLLPEGSVEGEGALHGGAEPGAVASDFALQAPLLDPCPLQVSPGRAPLLTLGGALCRHRRGRQAIWTSLPQPWPLPEHGAPRRVEREAVRGTGVGTASCSTAWAAFLDVPVPHHSLGSCVGVPCTGPGDSVTWGWGLEMGYTGGRREYI